MPAVRVYALVPSRVRRFLVFLIGGWAVLVAAVLAITFWPNSGAPSLGASLPGLRLGQLAPDFVLNDTHGNTVHLAALRGRTVLLNFWSPTCIPCTTEMPALQQASQEARQAANGRNAPVVLGVVGTPDTARTVAAFGRRVGVTYPLLLDSRLQVSLLDYHVSALPTSVLIGPQGRLRAVYLGPLSPIQMRGALGIG
jgi:peroxiredoxin